MDDWGYPYLFQESSMFAKPKSESPSHVGEVLEAVKFLDSYFTVESTIKAPGSDAGRNLVVE